MENLQMRFIEPRLRADARIRSPASGDDPGRKTRGAARTPDRLAMRAVVLEQQRTASCRAASRTVSNRSMSQKCDFIDAASCPARLLPTDVNS
jgi:hypothetical protein